MELTKGSKATHLTYGHGVIKSKAIYGYVNKDFDSEAKYDFLPDGGRFVMRLFESTLIPDPIAPKVLPSQKRYDHQVAEGLPEFVVLSERERVEFSVDRDPEAYALFKMYCLEHATVEVWCPPSQREDAINLLASLKPESSRTELADYVREGQRTDDQRQEMHSIKLNLLVPNSPTLEGLDERLVTNFDYRARGAGRPNLSRIFVGKQSLNRLLVTEGVPLRKWTGIDGDNDDEQSPSE